MENLREQVEDVQDNEFDEDEENLVEISEEEFSEYMKLKAKNDSEDILRNQLDSIEHEAFERIWLDRADPSRITNAETHNKVLNNIERIINQYHINLNKCDDFYHGYWSGVLAMSRYISGYYGTDSSIINYDNPHEGLLDT